MFSFLRAHASHGPTEPIVESRTDGREAGQVEEASPLDSELEQRRASVRTDDLQAVRAALKQRGGHGDLDDHLIHMFLRATGNNVPHAGEAAGRHSCGGGQKEKPDRLQCGACLARPQSHYLHPVGFDKSGRPVMYSVFSLASNRLPEDNRQHMIACFEQAIRLMPKGVEQWIWISDFHGFGFADCDPRIATSSSTSARDTTPNALAAF
eukprot:jgi/Botrbrau1/15280/Bobra.97_1s0006.1